MVASKKNEKYIRLLRLNYKALRVLLGKKIVIFVKILFRAPATCMSVFLVGDILHRVNHMLFAE